MKLTHDRLLELLVYDPETGNFTWRPSLRKNSNKEGRAGTTHSRGYRQITIDYVIYLEHRLAWFYMTEEWPTKIDHWDECKWNNAFSNLRIATSTQNNGNTSTTAGNPLGRGVTQFGKKFFSWIFFEKERYYLGGFSTPEEAHKAYKKKHLDLYKEFSIYHEGKVK